MTPTVRPLTEADAPFVLALLNDADFLTFIGDRGVHTVEQARAYAATHRLTVEASGFGMRVIEHGGVAIGLCGLLSRPWLADVDVGYALLPAFRGQGHARHATARMLDEAKQRGLSTVVALVSPQNLRSVRLLSALGFRADGDVFFPAETTPVARYRLDFR